MKRLLRRFAAWCIMKTGPVALMVRPHCGNCGHTFQILLGDISPILLHSIKLHANPGLAVIADPHAMARKILDDVRAADGGKDALRN